MVTGLFRELFPYIVLLYLADCIGYARANCLVFSSTFGRTYRVRGTGFHLKGLLPESAAEKPIAVTMGEPAGIGGELTLKAWLERRSLDMPAFFAIDDPDRLARLAKRLGWTVPVTAVDTPDAAPGIFADALPVLVEGHDLPDRLGE